MFKSIVLILCFAASIYAVEVKYHGNVDVSSFAAPSLKSSSVVQGIYYKQSENYLIVNLNGTYYHYCRIPANVVSSWINASSLGRYYHSNIRGNFDCRMGGIPK